MNFSPMFVFTDFFIKIYMQLKFFGGKQYTSSVQ